MVSLGVVSWLAPWAAKPNKLYTAACQVAPAAARGGVVLWTMHLQFWALVDARVVTVFLYFAFRNIKGHLWRIFITLIKRIKPTNPSTDITQIPKLFRSLVGFGGHTLATVPQLLILKSSLIANGVPPEPSQNLHLSRSRKLQSHAPSLVQKTKLYPHHKTEAKHALPQKT